MKPVIAKWYFQQWGHLVEGSSVELFNNKLNDYLNRDSIPLVIMAVEGEDVLGVAHLRYHEMTIYPDKEHWVGGVYIDTKHRSKGVASALVNHLESVAVSLGVTDIHLQTEKLDGGLYKQLGWQPIEQVNNRGVEVQVMTKHIAQ
ncbi:MULTISPECIES: GNAT family N-acetyltransferase [Pseudoalteromonas]|uniref:GNAT family N-acetyltransferase n=1 Tax=Pseudoalteromonas TaxID=53246 RepID=UPI00035E17B5|nr:MULTISPECIES: GNAT family N-acetyltransferase [Pseudoalteromonas]